MNRAQGRALELAENLKPLPKEIERVARLTDADSARWAFSQWDLRRRAVRKFTRAMDMLFDREGLEMASHEDLAKSVHVKDFPHDRVGDLTVGIGADLIALSEGREAVGYETDPNRAETARHNLKVYGRSAEIRVQDCLEAEWDFDFGFADPARRSSGRRTLRPEEFTPRTDALAERMEGLSLGRMKLSPMLSDEFLGALGGDRWFVSHERECKECLVHFGHERTGIERGVWCVHAESETWTEGEVPLTDVTDAPRQFLFEADPALIRAHGLGSLGAAGLGDSNGYLTSDSLIRSPWIKASLEVRWSGPWRPPAARTALRELNGSVEAVKCRGAEVDVRKAAQSVANEGASPMVLVLYPVRQRLAAVLAVRLPGLG